MGRITVLCDRRRYLRQTANNKLADCCLLSVYHAEQYSFPAVSVRGPSPSGLRRWMALCALASPSSLSDFK